MCFAINVYPINIDFVFAVKFDSEVDFYFTTQWHKIAYCFTHKTIIKHKTGVG